MGFSKLEIKNEYKTYVDSMSKDFYEPILKVANKYDRAVGFFCSSSLEHIAEGIVPFIKKGGYIRLIASPILSEEDVEAIKEGYQRREEIINNALDRELCEVTSKVSENKLNLLANLIADGRMDIKIALTKNDNNFGIYHEKMGVFHDQYGNVITFSGSMNETVSAMVYNSESIDVFCSWKNEYEKERTEVKKKNFEAIWTGNEPKVLIQEFVDVKESILKKYMKEKVDYDKLNLNDYVDNKTTDNEITDNKEIIGPKLPKGFIFHDYQEMAIDKWAQNGYQGIFDMATGTGKTYTGLGAIVKLADALDNKVGVFIVCPYQHLVEQWVEDIILFGMKPIIGYSSSHQVDWKRRLENAVRDQKLSVKKREFFCFITTNATFTSEFVQSQISKARGNLLLVIDEAHNFGAEGLRKLLSEKFVYRLALSATLDRHGDFEGTQALLDYFGEKCIEYDLDRAINEGKLTPYKYYPVIVSLSDSEREIYDDLSRQIARCLASDKKGKLKLNEKGKKLALKRARLVAGAKNKIKVLEQYIEPYKKDSHILVYCGATKVLGENKEYTEVDDEDLRQIDIVTDILGNKMKMKVSQFTSKEDVLERDVLKKEFSEGENLQALICIKCLDEGVNIPKIKVAFILASTTNPKEYIQRRGRVLRKAEGKEYAEIYDFITLPRELNEVASLTKEQMKREITLVKNELCRAEEFARISMNRITAFEIIEQIKEAYDLQDYVLQFEEGYYAD